MLSFIGIAKCLLSTVCYPRTLNNIIAVFKLMTFSADPVLNFFFTAVTNTIYV